MTADLVVLTSPLLPPFLELLRQGFEFGLSDDGTVQVRPIDRLPPETRALMRQHPDDLLTLVSTTTTPDVQARCKAFEIQLASTAPPGVPAFVFTPGTAYVKGHCFSCGERLFGWSYGRCWRCSLAWRMVCGLPLTPALAQALDEARLV